MRRRVDRHRLLAEQQVDPMPGPEAGGADQQPFIVPLAGEIVLRQRRPLVGRVRLLGEDRHRALEAEPAQRHRGIGAAMAAADDQDVKVGHGRVPGRRWSATSLTISWLRPFLGIACIGCRLGREVPRSRAKRAGSRFREGADHFPPFKLRIRLAMLAM
jgi:hypothetical protein